MNNMTTPLPEEPAKEDELEQEIEETLEKLDSLLRHIDNVRDNCLILGRKLIMRGEIQLGKQLIANSMKHDLSKFTGIEWDFLGSKTSKAKLEMAVTQHNTHPDNKHHPESWGTLGIHEMPMVYLAELTADWKARSEEFGTSLIEFIDEVATKRFDFKKGGQIYKEITSFVELLCDKPFKQKLNK